MKNWLILLAFALLFNTCARAEEPTYYTNRTDAYYHADPDCDRPPHTDAFGGARDYYDRACYQKYPISEVAAAEFEKAACPVCVKKFEPMYLGECPPEGETAEPWGVNVRGMPGSDAYCRECAATLERFTAYFEETYDRESDSYSRKHPYPDAYAGMWYNCTGGYSYAIVDPTPELMDSFVNLFGGGAWIVPARYGYNEICALQEEIFDLVKAWGERHPEFDLEVDFAALDEVANCLDVGLYGESYEEAIPVLDAELELPVWVRLSHVTERATAF